MAAILEIQNKNVRNKFYFCANSFIVLFFVQYPTILNKPESHDNDVKPALFRLFAA